MPEVGQQLAAHVAGVRSPLRKWLYVNRDAIAPMMAVPRPRWQALAKTAADNGIVDEHGNPPTRDAVRKAWQAIERTRNEKEPNRLQQIPANPPYQPQVVETQPVQKPPVIPDAPLTTQSRPRNVFKVATFKKDT